MKDHSAAELNQQLHCHDRPGSGSRTLESSLEETAQTSARERLSGQYSMTT